MSCIICGKEHTRRDGCDEKTLRAIDACHRRSDDDCTAIRTPSFAQRLNRGFEMLSEEYYSDDDED